MAVNPNDISMVLSGGSNNTDTALSLGGPPSTKQIFSGILNNLFDDVTPDESETGSIDYRAFYIANDSEEVIFNAAFWIDSEVDGGASVEIGIDLRNELQRVIVTGSVSPGDSMELSIEDNDFTVTVPAFVDVDEWASNFENAISALVDVDGLQLYPDVTVSVIVSGSSFSFDVLFQGGSGFRNQEQMVLVTDNMPGATITISTIVNGSPINSIAVILDSENNTPGGVEFGFPTEEDPIFFDFFRPAEFFAVWIKRTTVAGVESLANDGVTLSFRAETISRA